MEFAPEGSITENHPTFSVIILFWNSAPYINRCLDALRAQSVHDFEIILIDNGSPEPLDSNIPDKYQDLNINFVKLETNLGFAGGNNLGAGLAKGRYLALLNSDAFPAPDWLENIEHAVERYPDCSFASKQLMANSPDHLDGEGDVYHISGLVWRRSFKRPAAESKAVEGEVFSACAAAGVYPKAAFDLVGGFDPDYFAYVEDIDLGFRLRLAGYKCIYLPSAVVYHVGTGSTDSRGEFSLYHTHRNLIWTFFKNMPTSLLVLFTTLHLAANLGVVLLSMIKKRGSVMARANLDAFKAIRPILRKRKEIQKHRKASAKDLLSAMDANPFSPLVLYFGKRDEPSIPEDGPK